MKELINTKWAEVKLILSTIVVLGCVNVAYAEYCSVCATKTASSPPTWAPAACKDCTNNTYPYCVGSGGTKECTDDGGMGTGNCCGFVFQSSKCRTTENDC